MIMSIDSRVAQAIGQLVAADTNLRVTDIQTTIGNLGFSVSGKSKTHYRGDVCFLLLAVYPCIHHATRTSCTYLHGKILLYLKHSRSVSSNRLMAIQSQYTLMMQSFFRIGKKSSLNVLNLRLTQKQ